MFTLRSDAFQAGQPIPRRHTGDGEDVSPPLVWTEVPAGTKELALICDDPDAPTPQPWVHWLLYKIPPETTSLPEGIPAAAKLSAQRGALQGKNSWPSGKTVGYRGPAPPHGHGVHHYHFRLYALNGPIELEPGSDKAAVLAAISGHVLGEALLVGTYQR
jgi:Raf kinase inhibitor-like YbhB/YbcL family protein